jgi:hypothetical protein
MIGCIQHLPAHRMVGFRRVSLAAWIGVDHKRQSISWLESFYHQFIDRVVFGWRKKFILVALICLTLGRLFDALGQGVNEGEFSQGMLV